MPDFVQTAPYDESAWGTVRGMRRKWATTHDFLWITWRGIRWLVLHPIVLAGIIAGTWLWSLGVPLWLVLAAASAWPIWKADKSQVGIFAAALRRRGLRQSLTVVSNWWRIRRGWPTGSRAAGLAQSGRGGKIPWLRHWELTNAGMSAWVTCGRFGWSATRLAGKAEDIASGIERCRAVTVTQGNYPGVARVDFAFSDPLAEVIPITALPVPPRGKLSCGLTERGDPAHVWKHLGVLMVGLPGSGKSNMLGTLLASELASDEPFELWVADPAGGVELWEFSNGSPLVREYAADPAGLRRLIKNLHTAMLQRMAAMAGRERMHTPTKDAPRWFLVIDELIRLHNALGKETRTVNGKKVTVDYARMFVEILSMCRKAAITPIALTQIPFAHSIGEQTRILFPQKMVFRANDLMVTNSVFGSGSEALGAAASKISIKTPGVAYVIGEDERPTRIRGPLITDPILSLIARGILPDGIPTVEDAIRDWHNDPHVLYRWDNATRTPACRYVGITVDGVRRAGEHLSTEAKAELREPGVTMTIVQEFTAESCAADLEAGKTVKQVAEGVEAQMIRELGPPLNIAHNGGRRKRKAIEP